MLTHNTHNYFFLYWLCFMFDHNTQNYLILFDYVSWSTVKILFSPLIVFHDHSQQLNFSFVHWLFHDHSQQSYFFFSIDFTFLHIRQGSVRSMHSIWLSTCCYSVWNYSVILCTPMYLLNYSPPSSMSSFNDILVMWNSQLCGQTKII